MAAGRVDLNVRPAEFLVVPTRAEQAFEASFGPIEKVISFLLKQAERKESSASDPARADRSIPKPGA